MLYVACLSTILSFRLIRYYVICCPMDLNQTSGFQSHRQIYVISILLFRAPCRHSPRRLCALILCTCSSLRITGLSKFSLHALHEAEVHPMNFVPQWKSWKCHPRSSWAEPTHRVPHYLWRRVTPPGTRTARLLLHHHVLNQGKCLVYGPSSWHLTSELSLCLTYSLVH